MSVFFVSLQIGQKKNCIRNLLNVNKIDMVDIQTIKNRYHIIGNADALNRAIDIAVQVAPTDMSILITGESGVGKEIFSRIIHENSLRGKSAKNRIIAVNCGAIPEGTIESELFGHVKGAFTSADRDRKGYFEVADKGTIFLDEVGELPLSMQAKLLRVLESGEIIRVGSSDPQKVDVRVVAATNVDIVKAVRNGKFREDLYFRLNQISIQIPPLRERKEDIHLLFRKFAADIADRYKMPPVRLDEEAKALLVSYPWYGNVRELKNFTEKLSVIENDRVITKDVLQSYLKYEPTDLMPVVYQSPASESAISDRELLLKALSMGQMIHEMRDEINDLKNTIATLVQGGLPLAQPMHQAVHQTSVEPYPALVQQNANPAVQVNYLKNHDSNMDDDMVFLDTEAIEDEPLALSEREKNAIRKALEKHHGKRKLAAADLKISERTLYRKLREYGIE